MASSDARPIPIKNTALRITFPIYDADGDLVTGATGLDSEVSKDGGTFADCTNEATEIATSSGMYYLDLTSTEMNADTVAVIVKTSSSGAKTTVVVMYPQESGDVKVDVETVKTQAVTCSAGVTVGAYVGNATAALAVDASGRVDVSKIGGTTQTARDIGASVLLSSGTGTGQISLASGAVTAGTVSDKTGYSLTQAFPSNFSSLAITVGGAVTAGTVSDKTGYSLASTPPTAAAIAYAVWDEAVSGHLTAGSTGATLADTNGDAHLTYTDLADGGRIDLLIDGIKAKTDNLPASPAATGDIPSAATVADAVWDEALSGHVTAGSAGATLSSAGSAGDPWGTSLPGAYSAGTAGYILGTNLNATVGSRSSHSAADVWSVATRTLTAFSFTVTTSDSSNITAILADTSELQTDWTDGGRLDLILDARASQSSVNSLSIPTAAANATAVRSELATELARIDVATSTRLAGASYTAPLDAAGVRTAVGLASANLDTQLADIPTVAEFEARTLVAANYATASALSTVDGIVDDILIDTGTTIPAQISGLSIPTANQNADAVLGRSVSNVETTAGEHTLCTLVLAGLESSVSGSTWTIKRTDGTTTHATKAVTSDANADPITGVS